MTDRADELRELYIRPGTGGQADGSVDRPFGQIDQALRLLGQEPAAARARSAMPRFELVCVGNSADPPARRGSRFDYYVDPGAGGNHADGSELFPWPDIESAAAAIQRIHCANGSRLLPGDRIGISYRQVFSATRIELSKMRRERIVRYLLLAMALSLVVPVLLVLCYLTVKAWPALSLRFLLDNPRNRMTAGGIWAPLVGTFCLVLLSLAIAAPIGILAGVYLNEYARDNWLTRIINLAVVNLAGVPSIVHGLFGVGAFVYFARMDSSLLAAACTVAVMTLPVIITSTREALAAVPMSFRQACWNLGASRWQTIRTIVLPNSVSGILTGVILQVSRAAGETAPILFTGAFFYVRVADNGWASYFPFGLGDKFMALSYHLFALSTQVKGVSEELQFGTAVVLIGLVLAVNSLSIVLRIYLRSRKRW